MEYNFVANNIAVDAGLILISDKDYYGDSHEPIGRNYQKTFIVKPGKYNLRWKIENTWNGDVEGEGIVNVTSGKLIVSDPCYIIKDDEWIPTLEKTNYFENEPEGTVVLDSMGGDGTYDVEIQMERVDD